MIFTLGAVLIIVAWLIGNFMDLDYFNPKDDKWYLLSGTCFILGVLIMIVSLLILAWNQLP